MSETATSAPETPNADGADKRRSTRVVRAVPIIVVGTDALGQPFRESTSTVMVDCYGCKFQSRNYAPKNSTVMVEIFHAPGWDRRVVRGRVVWVQRPRTHRENYQIAVEMEVPGNVWGLTPSPADWFPHPDDLTQAPIEVSEHGTLDVAGYVPDEASDIAAQPSKADEEPAAPFENDLSEEARREEERISAQAEAELGEPDEFTITREQLDGEIQEALGRTLRAMIEQAAESAVRDLIQDVSERSSEMVEAARRLSQEAAEELDAKLRTVLDETAKSLKIEFPKPPSPKRRRKGSKRDS
jgi:hypothetical protein